MQGRRLQNVPVQTYLVPRQEDDIYSLMREVNDDNSLVPEDGPVVSAVSIAIAAMDTVIWYDHWEDGYDSSFNMPSRQPTTLVFGDDDVSNGCYSELPLYVPPGLPCTSITCCKGGSDVLSAGSSLILVNKVPYPRPNATIFYDGGDKIQASLPVAVTRRAFPDPDNSAAGGQLAGAVEVLDTENYGTEFVAPVGTDSDVSGGQFGDSASWLAPLQLVEFIIMASEDATSVSVVGASVTPISQVLSKGESLVVKDVLEGTQVTSSKPVQVHLLTGDADSNYEMRWYSILPKNQWDNIYYTPLGEGSVFAHLYNPGPGGITINWEKGEGITTTGSVFVASGQTELVKLSDKTDNENEDKGDATKQDLMTGYKFYTDDENDKFFGIVQVDVNTVFEWGHTLIPDNLLTNQVVIGDGRECEDPLCDDGDNANRVFVTPVEDATIFVDRTSQGTLVSYDVPRLSTLILDDDDDNDMSGATIFAVQQGQNSTGDAVDIAVVWGQHPALAISNRPEQLDLGTWQKVSQSHT